MDPSSGHHHHLNQEMSSQTLESMLVCTKAQQEKKPRPPEQALKCPRCDSTNTKFCYYNNYSLTQPRYFCKSCRRYWTKGGTLRNVPVGGGCRKNRRSSSSSSAKSRGQDQQQQPALLGAVNSSHHHDNNPSLVLSSLAPPLSYDSSDLSLAFARLQKQSGGGGQMGYDDHEFSMMGNNHHHHNNPSVNSSPVVGHGLFDALRSGFLETPSSNNSGFHHSNFPYYGNMGHVENGSAGGLGLNDDEIAAAMPYGDHHHQHQQLGGGGARTASSAAATSVKEEMCNLRSSDDANNNNHGHGDQQNRVLWGFPWQINGDNNPNLAADLDSGRQSWNGFGSWHGLINSPLM